jgi:hypothetical protein
MRGRKIFVNGVSYSVTERSGYLKADLKGTLGWTSVWADSAAISPYSTLVVRIKQALTGRQ